MNNHLHIALNVKDLEHSIRFYRLVFGTPPDKVATPYTRFTLHESPLVLGLSESKRVKNGNQVAHFGLRLASSEALEAVRTLLDGAPAGSFRLAIGGRHMI